jgi:pseudaminic acid synthase
MEFIEIEGHKIGEGFPPFFIAEISANHNQSLERALLLIDEAKASGVNAVKLQTYTADTMTLNKRDENFTIKDPTSLWYGKSFYDLYSEASTPWEWHETLFKHCREIGLIAFSTPFDATAVDFLENLKVPCYKIASLEITDLNLIEKVASTKKPLIISTGGATFKEIEEAVKVAKNSGCKDLILLKCTTAYPALAGEANLNTIPYLKKKFQVPIGLSDHTLGLGTAIASIALGASVIEKHLTLSREEGGLDAPFSLQPEEFRNLIEEGRQAYLSLGCVQDGPTISERNTLTFRRSLYFVKGLKKGEVVTKDHIKALRPLLGISANEYKNVIGKKVTRDIMVNEPVHFNLLEE